MIQDKRRSSTGTHIHAPPLFIDPPGHLVLLKGPR